MWKFARTSFPPFKFRSLAYLATSRGRYIMCCYQKLYLSKAGLHTKPNQSLAFSTQHCLSTGATTIHTYHTHWLVTGHAKLPQRNSCEWRSSPVIPLWPVDLSNSNYPISCGSQAVKPHNQVASYSLA